MRRFIVGWKVLGHARRFEAEIVNYADDFVVCGKAPADMMRGAVEDMMERLRLPINVTKTRSMRVPDEPLEFLGYRIGRNYRRDTGRAYIGTCPSRSSLVSVCRRISELTHRRYGLLDQETVVRSLNRAMTGWANYFQLGQALGVPDCPAFRIPPAMVDRLSLARFRRLFDCGENGLPHLDQLRKCISCIARTNVGVQISKETALDVVLRLYFCLIGICGLVVASPSHTTQLPVARWSLALSSQDRSRYWQPAH